MDCQRIPRARCWQWDLVGRHERIFFTAMVECHRKRKLVCGLCEWASGEMVEKADREEHFIVVKLSKTTKIYLIFGHWAKNKRLDTVHPIGLQSAKGDGMNRKVLPGGKVVIERLAMEWLCICMHRYVGDGLYRSNTLTVDLPPGQLLLSLDRKCF